MDQFAELAKEITTILGAASAIIGVIVACSKKSREFLKKLFMQLRDETGESEAIKDLKEISANQGDQINNLKEITVTQAGQIQKLMTASEKQSASINTLSEVVTLAQTLIENHVTGETDESRKISNKLEKICSTVEASGEFTRIQISKEVRDIFNEYNDVKKLPPEKWEYIEGLTKIYIHQLGGNSLAAKLLKEMESWEVENTENMRV